MKAAFARGVAPDGFMFGMFVLFAVPFTALTDLAQVYGVRHLPLMEINHFIVSSSPTDTTPLKTPACPRNLSASIVDSARIYHGNL